jgi:hypothetical protein
MKKEKKIPEEDYRGLLDKIFVTQGLSPELPRSSKHLSNYQALLFIRALRDFHKDVYTPSPEQIWLMEDLWHQIYRGNHEENDLNLFLFRHFKISHKKFLDRHTAYQATEAIKAMAKRRGIVLEIRRRKTQHAA